MMTGRGHRSIGHKVETAARVKKFFSEKHVAIGETAWLNRDSRIWIRGHEDPRSAIDLLAREAKQQFAF